MNPFTRALLVLGVLWFSVSEAMAQGLILLGNTFGSGATGFRAPIFGFDPSSPTRSQVGNPPSPLGNPAGTTIYGGPLLQGTGYTMALFAGPQGGSEGELTLAAITTFRTASGDVLPAGLVNSTLVTINGIPPFQIATLQIRVWDNKGGTITSWEQVLDLNTQSPEQWTASGKSPLFDSPPLGLLVHPAAPDYIPETRGWQSFNIYVVPEPPVIALCMLGAGALLLRLGRR